MSKTKKNLGMDSNGNGTNCRCSGCGRNTSIWDREKRLHHFQICKRYQNKLSKMDHNTLASATEINITPIPASATRKVQKLTDIIQEFKKQDYQSLPVAFTKSTFVKPPAYLPFKSSTNNTAATALPLKKHPIVSTIVRKVEHPRGIGVLPAKITIHPAALQDLVPLSVANSDIHPAALQPEITILTSQAAPAVSSDTKDAPPAVVVIAQTVRTPSRTNWSIPPTTWQPELLALLPSSRNVILYPIPDWVILHSPFSEQRITSINLFEKAV